MKQIRTAALSRHKAPRFVLLDGLDLIQVRKLSWLCRSLLIELVAMADHLTGAVSTSYAVLEALLDFDLAPTANDAPKPTRDRIRGALDDLVLMRLVKVDRARNEKERGLFLKVKSRVGISAPVNKRTRQQT